MKIRNPVLLLGLACFSLHTSGKLFAGTKQFSETTRDWAAPSFSLNLAIMPAPDSVAASGSWKDSGFIDSNWNVAGNWTSTSIPGAVSTSDGSADIATFKYGNNLSVNVDSTRSISTIIFRGGLEGAYTLQGGGLYVGFNGSISVNLSVTHIETVNSPIFLATTPNTTFTFNNESTSSGASLNIGGAVTGRQAIGGTQTLVLGGKGNGTISGEIFDGSRGGTVAIMKSGAGAWTISGANTYSGDTIISEGRLILGNTRALQNSTLNHTGAGTLNFGTLTSATLGGLSGSQGLALSNASNAAVALTAGNNNQNRSFAGVLSGNGSLTKTGNGTLTLTGSNSYSGATAVNGGTLLLNNAAALTASSAVTVNNSGSVLGGSGTIGRPVAVGAGAIIRGGTGITGSTLTVSGSLTLADNSLIQLALGSAGAHSTLARIGSSTWTFATGQAFTFLNLGAEQGTYQDIISGLSAAPNTTLELDGQQPGMARHVRLRRCRPYRLHPRLDRVDARTTNLGRGSTRPRRDCLETGEESRNEQG